MQGTNPHARMTHGARIVGADALGEAAEALLAGSIVAVPTETVYGLAARADDPAAIALIYRAKGRPAFNPLIVHVADLAAAESLAIVGQRARALAAAFWPGPLTMVLARRPDAPLAPSVCAGLPSVALRSPAHPLIRELLRRTGLPLAAPSANRSGAVSPTSAGHVAVSLGADVPLIVDGGRCEQGLESTIVALRDHGGWHLLRPGPISAGQIAGVLGQAEKRGLSGGSVEAPGQLASHYAPAKPLRLEAREALHDEFLIGFGEIRGEASLSLTGDLATAAARLYDCLHLADAAPQPRIAVAPIPDEGLGVAINDRLRRGAS